MKNYKIKHSHTDAVIFETEANSFKEAVEIAVKKGIPLQSADLRHAKLQNANLQSVNLQSANLHYANLQGTDLQGANLQGTNLQDTDLRNAYLQEADLQSADLKGANLQNTDLQYANFKSANLQGTDLQGADIDYTCWPLWCGSKNAIIDEKQARQLLYHAFIVSKKFCKPNKKQREFINDFHRIKDRSLEPL